MATPKRPLRDPVKAAESVASVRFQSVDAIVEPYRRTQGAITRLAFNSVSVQAVTSCCPSWFPSYGYSPLSPPSLLF
jgi:hypothetical protein